MRRAFFFIVAIFVAASSFASIPRDSLLDRASEDASAFAASLSESHIRASEVLAPFERPHESELTRALRQAYTEVSTTNVSGSGRFLSVDPTWESADLKKPQSWNRYAYVLNNPVNLTDPDGKCPFCVQVLKELAVDFVVDGSPTGSADLPKDPAQRAAYAREMQQWRLEQRAKEIHGALPEATQRRTTTAVAEVTNPDGTKQILVASSEKNLRPSQRAALRPGEVAVSGTGHAEQTIINAAKESGQKVEAVAASRPICPSCESGIRAAGARAASALKRVVREIFY
jgi:hypothetical protein